jgi:hypothetical protein
MPSVFIVGVIYPMEGVNDQVITTLRTWLWRIFSYLGLAAHGRIFDALRYRG